MSAEGWAAIAAGAAALVAVVAVFLTREQVRVAKDQTKLQRQNAHDQLEAAAAQTALQRRIAEDQQQPYVWLDFRPDPVAVEMLDLVLQNEGPTIATDVRVTIDPPVERSRQTLAHFVPLASVVAFRDGIASMPPGRHMRWRLGQSGHVIREGTASRHQVTIAFTGPFGPVSLAYTIDLADVHHARTDQKPGTVYKLTEQVTKVAASIDQVAGHLDASVQLQRRGPSRIPAPRLRRPRR